MSIQIGDGRIWQPMLDVHGLMHNHNLLVKEEYRLEGHQIGRFGAWLDDKGNFDEGYIEIPSNETLSGHAEILEF
ncbi:MAG: hypothetical protein V3S16_14170 [Candidatus Desulfatibia sp.]|uniref:hypothetical protein n=1 Tax=Candidatus Desulfatibia sp. TaxID=3101189 RepID=UPI002F2C4AF1